MCYIVAEAPKDSIPPKAEPDVQDAPQTEENGDTASEQQPVIENEWFMEDFEYLPMIKPAEYKS